ncbi:hypothetical protein ACFQ6Q_36825, partial [Streptomyces sp. NPDC056437]
TRPKTLKDLWEFEKKPTELEVEGSRVIAWATADNGEFLYWLVRPGLEPNQWTVMVNEARGDRWEHFSVSCTQFLAASLDGELQSSISLPPLYRLRSVHLPQGGGSCKTGHSLARPRNEGHRMVPAAE